jgi:protein-L-isoaspartate(D-aspartate) O-methyltransferase
MNNSILRGKMVDHIKALGIMDEAVLAAMRKVPRHLFVPRAYQHLAYSDRPLPIGLRQTISQPYMVALMTSLLELNRGDNVLEIGTGSGYQAAILAQLAGSVVTIERHTRLSDHCRGLFKSMGISNIKSILGDGTKGYAEAAPYSKIVVTAAAPKIAVEWQDQLDCPGILVVPVGQKDKQQLKIIKKDRYGNMQMEHSVDCIFVPLIGEKGW